MALQQHAQVSRPPAENWDDDLDLQGAIFPSATPALRNTSISVSSRQSIRSESNAAEEDWQVPFTPNDQDTKATSNALRTAKQAGIPIPDDVPASALVGGSIKRLGKQKSRRTLDEDWAQDLELPDADNAPLTLKKATPAAAVDDDFDDWGEGSLGIRNGGRHNARKPHEASTDTMSPSMASALTESEEDGLDGLVIPTGPLDFQAALRKRKADEDLLQDVHRPADLDDRHPDDGFDDIDFGPGDVFDPKKRALNKNVRHNLQTPYRSSPQAKPQATITFTDKANNTRLPRPTGTVRNSRLEPVLETGGATITRPRRAEAPQSAAQALRNKRSMPALRTTQTLHKQASVPSLLTHVNFTKPVTRSQTHTRQISDPHGRTSPSPTPLRHGPETPTRSRRMVAPATLAREASTRQNVTRPLRRQNFGNGTELDMFDDLPTSTTKEKQYLKQPSAKAPVSGLRNQTSQRSLINREKMSTPLPPTPRSPTKPPDSLPRFARDTAASRIAREQTIGATPGNSNTLTNRRSESVLASRVNNWPATVASRSPHASPSANRQAKRGPVLINPMGKENNRHCQYTLSGARTLTLTKSTVQDDAARKGMRWNQTLFRWEGNEAAMRNFDPTATPVHSMGRPQHSPPRPALITNMTSGTLGQPGIQVVGGMVFDPTKMCWLKMRRGRAGSVASNPMSPAPEPAAMEEDDDPFKDIEDLKDERENRQSSGFGAFAGVDTGSGAVNDGLHEEFDLGPAFIARQRDEETNWRSRIGAWFSDEYAAQRRAEGDAWKWAIVEEAKMVDNAVGVYDSEAIPSIDVTNQGHPAL